MKKFQIYFITFLFLFLYFNCQKDSSPVAYEDTSSSELGNMELYTFSPNSMFPIGNPIPLELASETKIFDVLDTLGRYLSKTYFYKISIYTTIITNIKFEVLKIEEIQTHIRPFRIATINLIDPDELCMGYCFQGSSGGYITAAMLAANFTQPHLPTPLLDGLIILYNGEVLNPMDHINLDRIITPGEIRQAVLNSFTKK